MLVHKRRAEHSAIMIGTNTAQLDNPTLTVRQWYGHNPVRIVLDRNQSLSPELHLFDGNVPTLVFTEKAHASYPNLDFIPINYRQDILPQIMVVLYERGLQSLLVEGGSTLLQSFIDADLWDEIFIEKCPQTLHSGVKSPEMNNKIPYDTELSFDRAFRHYTTAKLG